MNIENHFLYLFVKVCLAGIMEGWRWKVSTRPLYYSFCPSYIFFMILVQELIMILALLLNYPDIDRGPLKIPKSSNVFRINMYSDLEGLTFFYWGSGVPRA